MTPRSAEKALEQRLGRRIRSTPGQVTADSTFAGISSQRSPRAGAGELQDTLGRRVKVPKSPQADAAGIPSPVLGRSPRKARACPADFDAAGGSVKELGS